MTAILTQQPTVKVLLKNISWYTYEYLLQDLAEQPGVCLTYDQGTLEITTPLDPHEKYSELLGNFVEVLTDELNQDIYRMQCFAYISFFITS